jgi:hypothetical protein
VRDSAAEFVFAAEPTHAKQHMSVFLLKALEPPHTPVQYMAPIFRRMAAEPRLDLHVAYYSLRGAQAAVDQDFATSVKWDVPLLQWYSWTAIPNIFHRVSAWTAQLGNAKFVSSEIPCECFALYLRVPALPQLTASPDPSHLTIGHIGTLWHPEPSCASCRRAKKWRNKKNAACTSFVLALRRKWTPLRQPTPKPLPRMAI